MTIKFAEISIIRNMNKQCLYNSISRFFGDEGLFSDDDDIVILFDDCTICNIKDEHLKKEIKFSDNYCFHHESDCVTQLAVKINNIRLFLKLCNKSNSINNKHKNESYYSNELTNHIKYNDSPNEHSTFNMVYRSIDSHAFELVRKKSSYETPRFLMAYDDTIFGRNDIIYFLDCVFKSKLFTK